MALGLLFVIISTRPSDYCDHTTTGQSQPFNTDPFTPAQPIRIAYQVEVSILSFRPSTTAHIGLLVASSVCQWVVDSITVGLMVSERGRWYRLLSINRYNGRTNNTDSNLSSRRLWQRQEWLFCISLLFHVGKETNIVGTQMLQLCWALILVGAHVLTRTI